MILSCNTCGSEDISDGYVCRNCGGTDIKEDAYDENNNCFFIDRSKLLISNQKICVSQLEERSVEDKRKYFMDAIKKKTGEIHSLILGLESVESLEK